MTVVAAHDVNTMAALHAKCFDAPWSAAEIENLLSSPGVFALAVMPDAFILARAAAGESEILTLATAPHARRRGHARALVVGAASEAARRNATEMFLEVAADNTAALALYAGLGFVTVGKRPRYYVRNKTAADALSLRAALPLSVPG